jgi:hypothetical protein
MPAYVMRFSFTVTTADRTDRFSASADVGGSETDEASNTKWEPPRFVPAMVTELAGPGMRIESPLHVLMGERVLVVLGLDDGGRASSADDERNGWQKPPRVLEDIVVVRHAKRTPDGWSMAVELAGLSDKNVDELIHATSAAETRLHAAGCAGASERVLESTLVERA